MQTDNNVDSWRNFFTGWRSTLYSQKEQRWDCFFRSFSAIRRESEEFIQDKFSIPVETCEAFFMQFSEKLKSHRRSGNSVDIWQVSGIGTDEMRNSRILAWILSCDGDHGQGSLFLNALISLIWEQGLPVRAKAHFPSQSAIEECPYRTRTEACQAADGRSRVDVEISNHVFNVFLEVKVYAGESGDQLRRYTDSAHIKTRKWGVIYLTPNGKLPFDESLYGVVVPISWTDVVTAFHRAMAASRADAAGSALQNSFAFQAIRQFCRHISCF